MPSTSTLRKLDSALIAIAALKRRGLIAPNALIKPKGIAWVSEQMEGEGQGLSEKTIRRLIAVTTARLQDKLHGQGVSSAALLTYFKTNL